MCDNACDGLAFYATRCCNTTHMALCALDTLASVLPCKEGFSCYENGGMCKNDAKQTAETWIGVSVCLAALCFMLVATMCVVVAFLYVHCWRSVPVKEVEEEKE